MITDGPSFRVVFIQLVATLIRVLQTTAIGLSRGSGVIAALQYIICSLLASWQKVTDSQLAIQIAALARLEAARGYVPVAPSCWPLLLIKINTAMIHVRPLRSAYCGGIPIAARQKPFAIFLHWVHQYHVPRA